MQKTGKLKSVKLMPQTSKQIAPCHKKKGYKLPIRGARGLQASAGREPETAYLNKRLRKIAERTEIDKKVTTHVARHSLASLACGTTRDLKSEPGR